MRENSRREYENIKLQHSDVVAVLEQLPVQPADCVAQVDGARTSVDADEGVVPASQYPAVKN